MTKKIIEKESKKISKPKNPPIWAKLSSSMAYYLRSCDLDYSNEELLDDYLEAAFADSEIKGNITYLNKQTREWVEIDKDLQERIKITFIERIEKMREKYDRPYIPKKKELEELQENKIYIDNVIDFRKRS